MTVAPVLGYLRHEKFRKIGAKYPKSWAGISIKVHAFLIKKIIRQVISI